MECYHHRSLAQKRVFTENPQGAPRCAESADLPLFGRYVNRIFTWEGATDIVSCWVFCILPLGLLLPASHPHETSIQVVEMTTPNHDALRKC